ncbi:hypothetical protein K450DRAFT_253774 [Umbelopsis ramanniana AG]|uniref:Large ribosomal subunit protein uL5m n=1 Tax=Umbelopsis ramanniana AG TaxID=1314678 RepID=A0AAD5E5P1_UMBRA|nr:uncharacterized protein K450DRAFT_253774 [Umbelopsis ramanniana AG]KAI8577129.1 hypothetical protein K450DRAFT_253774 [Umbelopsis ramanniana AG]
MALRLLAQRSLARAAPSHRLFSTGAVVASSHGLNRLKEHYHNIVAEDLMVLTYDHTKVSPPTLKNADLEALLNNAISEKVEEPVVVAPKVEEVRKRKGGKPLKPIQPLKNGSNIPTLDKITVHAMVKDAIHQKNHILSAFMALQSITATKPEVIFAKTSVANWKLREGMPIGVKVTLRGKEMYQFLDKLVEIVLPRLKEWHGLPMTSGDGNGNIGIGFPPSALALFPEIEGSFDMYPKMTGFDVVFNTTANTNAEGRLLLSGFNVPFKGAKTQTKK